MTENAQRIHAALEVAKGDRRAAAKALGMGIDTLRNKIHASPDLKRLWTRTHQAPINVPTVEESVSVAPLIPKPLGLSQAVVMKTERELADMVIRENEELVDGLKSIGLIGDEVEIGRSLQKFYNTQYCKIGDITGGTVAISAIKLAMFQKRLLERYDELKQCGAFSGEYGHIAEREMVRNILDTSAELRKLNDMTQKGMIQKAVIDMKRADAKGGGGPNRGKPKFGSQPLTQVVVHPGANLTMNSGEKKV